MKPFLPKSTSYLAPGHFWSIPIDDHLYGCGVVLAMRTNREGKRDSRMFLAGLLDWIGQTTPNEECIKDKRVVAERFAHIKTIQMSGGEVIGRVEPWWNRPSEISTDDSIPTAGYNVLAILARKLASNLK
jgi:hypothetical protein